MIELLFRELCKDIWCVTKFFLVMAVMLSPYAFVAAIDQWNENNTLQPTEEQEPQP